MTEGGGSLFPSNNPTQSRTGRGRHHATTRRPRYRTSPPVRRPGALRAHLACPRDRQAGLAVTKAPAFQFYAADFLADFNVQMMTLEQVGAYIKLLCHAWTEGGLPNDQKRLARLVGCTPNRFKKIWEGVSPCWQERDGKLIQKRMEEVRDGLNEHRAKQAQRGRAGAKARWGPKVVAMLALLLALSAKHQPSTGQAMLADSSPSPSPVLTPASNHRLLFAGARNRGCGWLVDDDAEGISLGSAGVPS